LFHTRPAKANEVQKKMEVEYHKIGEKEPAHNMQVGYSIYTWVNNQVHVVWCCIEEGSEHWCYPFQPTYMYIYSHPFHFQKQLIASSKNAFSQTNH
jgi:hypothetical protein